MKKKIFALSLAAAILSMTAACTTARNDGANTGTMAGNYGYGETGTGRYGATDTTGYGETGTNRYEEADNLNTSNNGVILDNTDEVAGGVLEDAAEGVSNAANDLTDRTPANSMSGTDTTR